MTPKGRRTISEEASYTIQLRWEGGTIGLTIKLTLRTYPQRLTYPGWGELFFLDDRIVLVSITKGFWDLTDRMALSIVLIKTRANPDDDASVAMIVWRLAFGSTEYSSPPHPQYQAVSLLSRWPMGFIQVRKAWNELSQLVNHSHVSL